MEWPREELAEDASTRPSSRSPRSQQRGSADSAAPIAALGELQLSLHEPFRPPALASTRHGQQALVESSE